MAENIKVSVVLTSFNHEKHLREAVDSVLNQTFSDFELIIIDDGSTDGSWEVIRGYSDHRVRAFRNESYNHGAEYFKRAFLQLSKGEYIAIHHSDDAWEPEKLEKQVTFLDSNPNIGAVFTWVQIIDEHGKPSENTSHPYHKIFQQRNRERHEWLNHFFYQGNALCHPSVLIRRNCYDTCGSYRYGFAQLGDLDMWVRLCLRFNIHVLPEKLTRFRVRENETNASGNNMTTYVRTQFESLQILDNYLQIDDPAEFVKIFPDSAQYFTQQQYDLGFALAMSALRSEQNFSKLFALRLLWKILNDENRARTVKDTYNFSNRDLTQLTARHDVFSVARLVELYGQLNQQNAMLETLSSQLTIKEQAVQQLSERIHEIDDANRQLSSKIEELDQTNQKLSLHLADKERNLKEIENSKTWKTAVLLQQIRFRLLPPHGRLARSLRTVYRLFLVPGQKIIHNQRLRRDMALIKSSGLFDPDWYLAKNPDVAAAGLNPLFHYLNNGGFEGRDPGPGFNSQSYLSENHDIQKAGLNPLLHYLKHGRQEGRTIQPAFMEGADSRQDAKTEWMPAAQTQPPGHRRLPSQPLFSRRWFSPKELTRKALLHTQLWVSRRPALKNLLGSVIPMGLRTRIIRAIQVNESVAEQRANTTSLEIVSDWENYIRLSERIRAASRASLSSFVPEKPALIVLDEKKLGSVAASLKLPFPEEPKVSIVIPVHNHPRLTLECLASIVQYTDGIDYETIIVDDGSDPETIEVLRAIPNLTLLCHAERLGFTQTCNKGAEAARGEYVLFLNNDAQVTDGWLRSLVGTFDRQDQVGAVGAKVLYPDGRLQEAGNVINQDGTTTLIGLMDDPLLPRYNFVREVDYCSAVCLMVRADVFREVGGFDEMYSPAYYEDVDLCFKIRASGRRILYCPQATVIHHLSATANKIDMNFKLQLAARNRQRFVERWQGTLDDINRVKLIAFYLPQYHPFHENDLWWGKGFTEWTNVTRARPNYEGHYQPHLPADLGFYDLRIPEVMEQQVELAKKYHIDGFCYYYYWFGGKRLLELPLERMLETGKPDFPFCLCWANENWSRRWDGSEDSILIAQNHSDDDDQAVIEDIARYMRHLNYIRVEGKPILLIYRTTLFPNIEHTIEIWRETCRRNGLGEIHLIMVKSFDLAQKFVDPAAHGFDATVEFPPHNFMHAVSTPANIINNEFRGVVGDYSENILSYLDGTSVEPSPRNYLTVFPRWDNTPRRQNAPFIFEDSNPGAYQSWLEKSIEITRRFKFGDEKLVFINAWNEWAEGNYLEPDQRFGHRYLEATRNAMEKWQLKYIWKGY